MDPGRPELQRRWATLEGGRPGLALYCAYLARAGFGGEEVAARLLEEGLHAATGQELGPALCDGLASLVCDVDVALDRARPLLDGAVAWLLAQGLADADSCFPSYVGPGIDPRPSRLAW